MNQIAQHLVFYGLPTAAVGAVWAGDKPACDKLRNYKSCSSAQNDAQAISALIAGERAEAKKKAVNDEAVHKLYRLKGVFVNKLVVPSHEEFQVARYAT